MCFIYILNTLFACREKSRCKGRNTFVRVKAKVPTTVEKSISRYDTTALKPFRGKHTKIEFFKVGNFQQFSHPSLS